jgi:hypothetical protein
LSNSAYELVAREVDVAFDGNMAAVVKEKAIEVINSLTDHTVFRRANAWEKGDSKAYIHLQEVMAESKPLIAARVAHVIETTGDEVIEEKIGCRLVQAIMERITKPEITPI